MIVAMREGTISTNVFTCVMNRMRLIDAELLKRRLIEGDGDDEFTEGYNCAINEIMGYIDNMPTIEAEPVKRGRWIVKEQMKLIQTGKIRL